MDLIRVKSIQLAIKLLILSIFLGYIMIWIMMPTNVFWLHWSPRIHAETDSMFFGQQGANILVYTSPILLIATLGCIYLHLDRYTGDSNNRTTKDSRFATWARPVFVRGPLGIVSWTELSFILMFIVLLIWSISAYVHGMFKNITRQSSSKIGELVWEVKLDSVALMLGLVGNICLSFLFFPINRGSSILRLVGVTSESSVKYHIWLGHTVLTLFTAHGVCYIIYWATTHQISEMLKWDRDGISNVAGEVALLSGIVMWITSHSLVRRKIFELFFYTHHLYIVFVFFFILHVGFSYSCIMLPGFYLFIIDRFLRFLQSQQRVFLISARVLPCHALELNFSKDPTGLSYNPSSIVFIKVKSISKLQWHPFTVTSNSKMDPHQLSIVIKSEGTWSRNLYENLSSPTPIERLEISVEGPYSPTSTSSYLRHEMLVMVSGGSGVTPFISIIRELVFIANTDNEKNIPRIILVAAFKKSEDLAMLDLLLPFSRTSHDVSRVQIQIQAYVTRDKNPTTEKGHKTIWFKPSVSDKPISVVLAGSRSWLWLGAIISSSFIVFLLLIGLINRYYIYPIDHNTYLKYSQAARSTITTSVLCASVVITATLAFLWNKNKNNKDKNQIQSADSSNQVPEPWLYEVDRELGSFPNQSLKRVTTVHYGERPNMKKILSECEELNVGVLVSGPKKMRQEVAAICCSSKNLHYESFSFNW